MIERKFSIDNNQTETKLIILPIWILAIYAFGLLITEASTVCIWVICSFFIFILLDPVAERLKRHRWPTALAAVVLVLAATAVTVLTIYMLGSLFSGVIVELEQSKKLFMHMLHSLSSSWNSINSKISSLHPAVPASANPDVSKVEIVQSSPIGGELGGTIMHGLGNAATIFTFTVLTPILTFFFLAERDGIGKVLKRAYRAPEASKNIWAKIVKSTKAFFLGNLVLALITYPIFVLLFWLFEVPSLFGTAVLATFFNIIPFAGAALSGLIPAVALYTQTQSVGGAFGLYGCCVFIHFIVADFVTPKILGSQVNINATTSTIALVAWGELWGATGLILAIPLTSMIKILFESSNFFWLQWIAGLMSEDVDTSLKTPKIPKIKVSKNKA